VRILSGEKWGKRKTGRKSGKKKRTGGQKGEKDSESQVPFRAWGALKKLKKKIRKKQGDVFKTWDLWGVLLTGVHPKTQKH